MNKNIKYLKNGKAVQVVSEIVNGFLVRDCFEDASGDAEDFYFDDKVYLVDKVFDNAPTEVLDMRIQGLEKEVLELQTRRDGLFSELRALEQADKKLMEKLKRTPTLKRLDDFLSGKITHLVVDRWDGVDIYDIKGKECRSEYGRDGAIKLLSLFGESNGNIAWRLNQYSDGSGSGFQVFPCCSIEEAKAKAQEFIDHLTKETKANPREGLPERCRKAGLVCPDWYVQRLREIAIENAQGKMKEFTEKAEAQKNLIETLKGDKV